MDRKIIHFHLYDPSKPGLFKRTANEKASYTTIACSNLSCPLLKEGKCVMRQSFSAGCPYGKKRTFTGYTRRAKNYNSSKRKPLALAMGMNFG